MHIIFSLRKSGHNLIAIGSVTPLSVGRQRTFTAIRIMQIIREGKLAFSLVHAVILGIGNNIAVIVALYRKAFGKGVHTVTLVVSDIALGIGCLHINNHLVINNLRIDYALRINGIAVLIFACGILLDDCK